VRCDESHGLIFSPSITSTGCAGLIEPKVLYPAPTHRPQVPLCAGQWIVALDADREHFGESEGRHGASGSTQAAALSCSFCRRGFIPKSTRMGLKGRISTSINPSVIRSEPATTMRALGNMAASH